MTRHHRPQDHWGHRARREGYPARSVYKLQEIDRQTCLLRPGMRVLDLGACPGSWTTYAASRVGPSGRVLGLDLLEFRGTLPHHAEIRQQDVMASDLETQLEGERFDVVLSDMAPSTCGHRLVDQTRSFRLVMRAIEIADRVLVVGGHFVAKIFQGPDFDRARGAVAERFADSRIIKPPASRAHSREIFLVGLRKKT